MPTLFFPVKPNARPEPLPEAGAQRTLEAVGSRPLLGGRLGQALFAQPLTAQPASLRFGVSYLTTWPMLRLDPCLSQWATFATNAATD